MNRIQEHAKIEVCILLGMCGIFGLFISVLIAIVPISEYNILGGCYHGIFNYS